MSRRLTVDGGYQANHWQETVRVLNRGGAVLMPVEDNYLLVSLKEERLRPFGYAVHQQLVLDRTMFDRLVKNPSPELKKIADQLLPGDLTLLVETARGRTALMMPSGDFTPGLVSQVKGTLHFQEVLDCETAVELEAGYGNRVDLWIDSGGLLFRPSTLLDLTVSPPRVERKGLVPILDIERVIGHRVRLGQDVTFAVLFVCTGNTCRSAIAQGILEHRTRELQVHVSSAGTAGPPGVEASEFARLAAKEHGVDLSRHSSSVLTRQQIMDADIVLCMAREHKRRVLELAPEAAARTFLLTEYAGKAKLGSVPDPLGSSLSVFRGVAGLIAECLDPIVAEIAERRQGMRG